MPKLSCFDAALKLLARRGYAVKEIAGKLKDKGYKGFDIYEAIERLEEKGWLNDTTFSRSRARYRAEVSRWGKARIVQELKQRGVEADLINKAVELLVNSENPDYDIPHDFKETAVELISRRFGVLNTQMSEEVQGDFESKTKFLKTIEKEKKRRLNFLLRRGFSMGESMNALEKNKE